MARAVGRLREGIGLFLSILSGFGRKTQAGYVQSSSLPVKNFVQSEQIQQYQLTDTVDVYYANRNFLKSKGFKLPDTGIKKLF